MIKRKNFWLITLCIIIVSLPVLNGNIHGGDDMIFHVARIKSISEGNFWIYPKWLYDFGSPVGIFYPSLFFMIPALILKLGASIEFVVNSFSVLIIAGAAASSFIAFKILFDNERLATIASICYISQWYFQIDLFFRTDLGESVAMVFLPLAIASSGCLFRNYFHGRSSWIFAVISYTGLIESNVPMMIVFIAFLISIWIFEMIRQRSIDVLDVDNLAKIILATLGLNTFFLAPLGYFFVTIEDIAVAENENLISMWAVDIGYALDVLRHAYFLVIPFLIFTGYKIFRDKIEFKPKWIFLIGLIILSICVVIESNLLPWEYADDFPTLTRVIEYPWRIMSIASIYFTASMAIAIYQFKKYFPIICILISAYSISFGGNAEFNKPQEYLGWFAYRTVEFSPDLTSATFSDGKQIERIDSTVDKFSYFNAQIDDLKLWLEYWDQREDKNEVPILFYEGYRAVDSEGNEVDIEHSERHLIRLAYAEERGKKISFNYEGLIEFKFAIVVSVVTCGILLVLWRNSFE